MFEEFTQVSVSKEIKVEKSTELLDEVTETVRLGGIRSSIIKNTSGPKLENSLPEVKEAKGVLANKIMNEQEAKAFFAEYAQRLASQNRRSLSAFLADPILVVNQDKITFTVGSKNVAKDIEDETMKIIKQAAQEGWVIATIETLVDAVKVSDYQVFTPKQQFDVLAKDFPILKDFEERFNLDFDA